MPETRWEWAVVYGIDTADLTSPIEGNTLTYDDQVQAREMVQWLRDSMVVRRRVTVGQWEPAPAEEQNGEWQQIAQQVREIAADAADPSVRSWWRRRRLAGQRRRAWRRWL